MVRIERLVILLLSRALLQAGWKLYRGKVKHWWKRVKDRLSRHWRPKSRKIVPCLKKLPTRDGYGVSTYLTPRTTALSSP